MVRADTSQSGGRSEFKMRLVFEGVGSSGVDRSIGDAAAGGARGPNTGKVPTTWSTGQGAEPPPKRGAPCLARRCYTFSGTPSTNEVLPHVGTAMHSLDRTGHSAPAASVELQAKPAFLAVTRSSRATAEDFRHVTLLVRACRAPTPSAGALPPPPGALIDAYRRAQLIRKEVCQMRREGKTASKFVFPVVIQAVRRSVSHRRRSKCRIRN